MRRSVIFATLAALLACGLACTQPAPVPRPTVHLPDPIEYRALQAVTVGANVYHLPASARLTDEEYADIMAEQGWIRAVWRAYGPGGAAYLADEERPR